MLHNLDAEQSLLGALLLDNKLADNLPVDFAAKHFASVVHGNIFAIIQKIRNAGGVADPITIVERLRDMSRDSPEEHALFTKAGGQKYLLDLATGVVCLSSVHAHALIVMNYYKLRELARIGNDVEARARSEDEADLIIASAEKELYDLATSETESEYCKRLDTVLIDVIAELAMAQAKGEGITGVTTGFTKLNEKLGGMQKSDLLILAGRPSMGKTALATNIGYNAAKAGHKVLLFSLEMPEVQIGRRILAGESELSAWKLRSGDLNREDYEQIATATSHMEKVPFYMDDTASITIPQLLQRARYAKRQHGIELVIVDYLQLITPEVFKKNGSRVYEISEISKGLKAMAKELDIPVLALSQLSRAVEARDDKKPQLSDLRDSGSIEQDADVVMFVYREEYYKARKEPTPNTPAHDRWAAEMDSVRSLAETIIAKHRNGPVGTVKLNFSSQLTRFDNLAEY